MKVHELIEKLKDIDPDYDIQYTICPHTRLFASITEVYHNHDEKKCVIVINGDRKEEIDRKSENNHKNIKVGELLEKLKNSDPNYWAEHVVDYSLMKKGGYGLITSIHEINIANRFVIEINNPLNFPYPLLH